MSMAAVVVVGIRCRGELEWFVLLLVLRGGGNHDVAVDVLWLCPAIERRRAAAALGAFHSENDDQAINNIVRLSVQIQYFKE